MKKSGLALAIACALVSLIVLAPVAVAEPGAAPPGAKATADAAAGPSYIGAGDALPLPSVPADFWDSLAAPEYEDLWTVYAAAGQEIVLTMAMPDGEDFDLALWAPGTTDFSLHSNAAEVSWHFGSVPEGIRYTVPAGAAGLYYIDVWSMSDPVASYDYHLTAAVQEPGADIQPIPSVDFIDTLDAPDYEDLWTVSVKAGQQLIVTMNPPSGGDFDLALWAPGTTDFSSKSAALRLSAHYSGLEDLKYIVPSGAGGRYIIDVWADGDGGQYRLRVNKQSPSRTAVRITPPAVPYRCVTGRSYTAYGTLKPLHFRGDQTVKVVWQKYSGGRWRADSSERVRNLNYRSYTRFKVSFSFWGYGSGTMRWRVRAIHLADKLHPQKASAWRYFTVRFFFKQKTAYEIGQ